MLLYRNRVLYWKIVYFCNKQRRYYGEDKRIYTGGKIRDIRTEQGAQKEYRREAVTHRL